MREILHFNSTKEKIAYLKGQFHEVLPKEVEEAPAEEAEEEPVEVEEVKETSEEALAEAEEENDEVQAE